MKYYIIDPRNETITEHHCSGLYDPTFEAHFMQYVMPFEHAIINEARDELIFNLGPDAMKHGNFFIKCSMCRDEHLAYGVCVVVGVSPEGQVCSPSITIAQLQASLEFNAVDKVAWDTAVRESEELARDLGIIADVLH